MLTDAVDTAFGPIGVSNFNKTYLDPGDEAMATVSRWLASDSLAPHTNVVTVTAKDNEGTTATDDDDATVTFDDVAPVVRARQGCRPRTRCPSRAAPSPTRSRSTTSGTEPFKITSLTDDNLPTLPPAVDRADRPDHRRRRAALGYLHDLHVEAGLLAERRRGCGSRQRRQACDRRRRRVGRGHDVLPTVTLDKSADPKRSPSRAATSTSRSPSPTRASSRHDHRADGLTTCRLQSVHRVRWGPLAAAREILDDPVHRSDHIDAQARTRTSASVTVEDNEGNPVPPTTQTVWVDDVPPTVTLDKSVDPTTRWPSRVATSTSRSPITNTSVEPVEITAALGLAVTDRPVRRTSARGSPLAEVLVIEYPVSHTDADATTTTPPSR